MAKCDYVNCKKDAVANGCVYDTSTNGSGDEAPIPVSACEDHRELDTFVEDTRI